MLVSEERRTGFKWDQYFKKQIKFMRRKFLCFVNNKFCVKIRFNLCKHRKRTQQHLSLNLRLNKFSTDPTCFAKLSFTFNCHILQ